MSFVERTVDQGNIEKKVCVCTYTYTHIYISNFMNGKTGSHSCWNLFKLRNVLSCIDVWPVACRVLYPLYRLILDLLVFIFFSFNLEII